MEQVDLGREARQVGRLLERRVAATDDRDLAVLEEEAVAGRAGAHAAAAQAGLAVEAEPQRRGAGRDDDGLGAVLRATRPDPERPLREVDPVDVDVDDARAEALRLGAHRGHQLRALDAVREARVVLDVAREHQLAARRGAGEDDRLEVGAGRVDGRGQAGRPGADDDDLGVDPALAAGDGRSGPPVAGGGVASVGASIIAMEKPPNGLRRPVGHRHGHRTTGRDTPGGYHGGHPAHGLHGRQDVPPDLLEVGRLVDVLELEDDVLRAGIGQLAEAVDDLVRRSRRRRAPAGPEADVLERRALDLVRVAADRARSAPRGSRTCGRSPRASRTRCTRRRTGRRGGASSSRRRRRP